MASEKVQRLALHLGLTSLLIQKGTSLGALKQQMVTLRKVAQDVILDEDQDDDTFVQLDSLLPTDVADVLAEGCQAPDDLRGL